MRTYCKIRYVSKFAATSRGSPCDSTAFLLTKGRFGHFRHRVVRTVEKIARGHTGPTINVMITVLT